MSADGEPAVSPMIDFGSWRSLIQGSWWKSTLDVIKRFAPRCVLPTVLLTAANVLLVAFNIFFYSQLGALSGSGDVAEFDQNSLARLVVVSIVALLTTILALSVTLFAATLWLLRLTEFCRAFILHGHEATKADFEEAAATVKSKKGFLVQFWLLGSVYLLVPVVPILVCLVALIVTRPEFSINGQRMIPLPAWLTHEFAVGLNAVVVTSLMMVVLAYTNAGIASSSVATGSPWHGATQVLRQTAKHAPQMCLLAVVVLAINVLVSAPLTWLAPLLGLKGVERNIPFMVATQIWLGVTSLVLWPASLAPFCIITSREAVAHDESEHQTA